MKKSELQPTTGLLEPTTPFQSHRFYESTLNDAALNSLIDLLIDMQPGQQLPSERELTHILNVSRNTLRDRIGRLESMGALSRKERQGTFYTGVQAEQTSDVLILSLMFQQMTLESLISVRHALERQAAIEACVNATPESLAELDASIEVMRHTEDGKELLEADASFHRALFAASESPALLFFSRMLHSVLKGTLKHLTLEQDFETMRRVHTAIVDALKTRDPQAVTETIDAHFDWLRELRSIERAAQEV